MELISVLKVLFTLALLLGFAARRRAFPLINNPFCEHICEHIMGGVIAGIILWLLFGAIAH